MTIRNGFTSIGSGGFRLYLIVALVGLITLVPRPTVALQPPLDPKDILSSRFEIANDGYFDLEHLRISSFIVHVEYEGQGVSDHNVSRD